LTHFPIDYGRVGALLIRQQFV